MAAPLRSAEEEGHAATSLEGRGVRLTVATGCFRGLNWNLELEHPVVDWADAVARLVTAGWRETSRLAGLFDLVSPEAEHHLVIVPRSEWMQLRVSYLVPQSERSAIAAELAERVAAIVRA